MGAYRVAFAAALAIVGAAAAVPATNVDGPPPGHTGGFGEPTCLLCHVGAELNGYGGRVWVRGLPDRYEPGESYLLIVVLEAEETAAAGFQLSARYGSGERRGERAGELASVDGRVAVRHGDNGLRYAQHTREGIRTPDPGGATWIVRWTAPDGADPVTLNVAANSANGDDSPLSDLVYVAEIVVRPEG
jgi:hypothetical protein